MKTLTAVLGLLLSAPILAVEAPKIVAGDYLLVYARIVNCGPELQAIEAGHVDEKGVVTLFGDVSLVAEGRAVYAVRNELVDVMEDKTGHRSQSLELIYISGRDKKAVAMRLMQFWAEVEHGCSRIVLPPMDLDPAPGDLDPNWAKEFERLVHSPHNKSLNSDTGDAGAG